VEDRQHLRQECTASSVNGSFGQAKALQPFETSITFYQSIFRTISGALNGQHNLPLSISERFLILCLALQFGNTLEPARYKEVEHDPILRSAHTVYLCVLYGSENKQRLFPYTTITDRFL